VIIPLACLVAVAVIAWLLFVGPSALPAAAADNPAGHLIERRAAIYENLRDLQFEYRVGKLSDADYQNTKRDLQKELASVLAQMDGAKLESPKLESPKLDGPASASLPAVAIAAQPATLEGPPYICPTCKAMFDVDLKFCGECGKPMKEVAR
jgi:hypothetical protein